MYGGLGTQEGGKRAADVFSVVWAERGGVGLFRYGGEKKGQRSFTFFSVSQKEEEKKESSLATERKKEAPLLIAVPMREKKEGETFQLSLTERGTEVHFLGYPRLCYQGGKKEGEGVNKVS